MRAEDGGRIHIAGLKVGYSTVSNWFFSLSRSLLGFISFLFPSRYHCVHPTWLSAHLFSIPPSLLFSLCLPTQMCNILVTKINSLPSVVKSTTQPVVSWSSYHPQPSTPSNQLQSCLNVPLYLLYIPSTLTFTSFTLSWRFAGGGYPFISLPTAVNPDPLAPWPRCGGGGGSRGESSQDEERHSILAIYHSRLCVAAQDTGRLRY